MGTIWCIKGGRDGEADDLFLRENRIALAWSELGDLKELVNEKTGLKNKIESLFPDMKHGAIPVYTGILIKFVNDIKIGDIVVYPSKIDKLIHIGKIEGNYEYNPKKSDSFPNQRSVVWLQQKSRTEFSQSALYEIGSLLTLIQIKDNADEFEKAYQGKISQPQPEKNFEEIDYEQRARDFVVKLILKEIKGHPFTHLFAALLRAMGYRTKVSPPGPDHGIDITASKDAVGTPPLIKIQCKGVDKNRVISESDIGYLDSDISENEIGLFVNFGQFSSKAKEKAFHSKKNLRLIDQDDFLDLLFEYYDQLEVEWQKKIPLKKVFVPNPDEEID